MEKFKHKYYVLNPLRGQRGNTFLFMLSEKVTVVAKPTKLIALLVAKMSANRRLKLDEIVRFLCSQLEDVDPNVVLKFANELVSRSILLEERESRPFVLATLTKYLGFLRKKEKQRARKGWKKGSPLFEVRRWGPSMIPELLLAAVRENVDFTITLRSGKIIEILFRKDGKVRLFSSRFRYLTEADERAYAITEYKWVTNFLCKMAQIPVPDHKQCRDLESGKEFVRKIGFPVVVKPNMGADGKDVFPNVRDLRAFEVISKALLRKYREKGGVVVEKRIEGNNYRLIVLGDKVIAAYAGLPPVVVGDGRSSIKDLVERENERRVREGAYNRFGQKAIVVDDELKWALRSASLTLQSIPRKGFRVQVHFNLNRGKGTTVEKIPIDRIHREVCRMAVKTVKLVGLHHGAVDYVAPELTSSPQKSGGMVCEIQAHPALDPHILDVDQILQDMIKYIFRTDMTKLSTRIVLPDFN